jgi:uncharacterized membrane protein YjgN (DUF898 family)
MARSQSFRFDGGAGTYVGTGILAFAITLATFGIATPFAIVLRQRWRAKHTYVNGHRLVFVGTGVGLFGLWIKWLLLTIVTLGIYAFWLVPQVTKWVVENTDFDPSFTPGPAFAATGDLAPVGGPSELPTSEGSGVLVSGTEERTGEDQPPQLV